MTKRIVIIGAGFAGLAAAKNIRKLSGDVEIILVAPKAEFVYLPSVIWMASGKRTADDITIQLDNFFARHDIKFIAASVTGLSDKGRTVQTDQGDIKNDGVVIACGGRFIKKLPGIKNTIIPCEGTKAGEALRQRLCELEGGTLAFGFSGNPKEPAAMRGGPIFEFLFGTDQLLRKQGRRDKFKLVFFSPAPKPGLRLGEQAVGKLLARMKALDIDAYTGEKLAGFTKNSFKTVTQEVAADMIVFIPGMTGNTWFSDTGLPLSEGGLIKAGANARVEGDDWECTYVAGDAGSFPGPKWMPKQAHMAELQAHTAAKNLNSELNNEVPDDKFETELLCLIDSENKGALVYRKGTRAVMLPPLRLGHWAKRAFEKLHLRQYR